jgi:hypothetical protein
VAKFIYFFVQLDDPDIETQQKLGREWLATLPEWVVESYASFDHDAKLVTRDSVRDFREEDIHYGGYMIVNSASFEEAVKIGQGSPHVALGGRIMVRPLS